MNWFPILALAVPALHAGDPLDFKNSGFSEPGGNIPAGWSFTGADGASATTVTENGETFVRIEAAADGGTAYIEQIVPLPPGTRRVELGATFRHAGIVPGERGYQRGKIQGRHLAGGDQTGPWIDVASVAGDQPEWTTAGGAKDVPDGADAVLLRLGMYDVKAGRLDVRTITSKTVTDAGLAAERAKFRPAEPYGDPVSPARLAKLAKGVNINGWFCQPYNVKGDGYKGTFDAGHFDVFVSDDELARLKRTGFRHIRLAIDPEPFIDKETGGLDRELLPALDATLARIARAGLAVIFDPHPKMSYFKRMSEVGGRPERFLTWWGEMAAHLAATTDPERVFLETLNEPGGQAYYGAKWSDYQDRLITAIRAAAPGHTIIANAGGYQLVKEQIQVVPHPDRNVAYAVHYYEPSQFTHQGAEWMKDWYVPLRNVPWPATEDMRGEIGSWIDGDHKHAAKARSALGGMLSQKLATAERLAANFEELKAWSDEHGRALVINEFGVFRKHADREDGIAWLKAVTSAAEERGFGWSLWEFTGDFGFAGNPVPGKREWDEAGIEALGL